MRDAFADAFTDAFSLAYGFAFTYADGERAHGYILSGPYSDGYAAAAADRHWVCGRRR